MSDDEIIDNLHREIAKLTANNWRLENENVALATANSELRSELRELREILRSSFSSAPDYD